MRTFAVFAACLAVVLCVTPGLAVAQGSAPCSESESGFQVCGEFQSYWERNEGQALLGQPLSNEFQELWFASGTSRNVQYFELQRLELHFENAGTAYEIMLGRLGSEVLAQQGQDWAGFSKDDPGAPHFQQATGFAISPEFIDFWSSQGIDLGDEGVSFRESLALFGYPISTGLAGTDAAGASILTQWFERARLEYRAGSVEIAPLGREVLDVPGVVEPVDASMLAQVQAAAARNGDPGSAEARGWGLVEGLDHCFNNPGVGAMGIHYINVDLLDTSLDPLQPEAMVYQHAPDGTLSLGAVEWIVPAEPWDAGNPGQPPEVLGRMLHLNEALGVYVLHGWIFRENPSGVFEDWNPDVSCPGEGQEGDDLDALRAAVAQYQDLNVATADGYQLVDGLDHCFDNPGVGAMGIHYINVDLLDTALDPLQPEAMVYQHGPDGELSLGAVEWIVPAEAWDAESHDQFPSVMDHELHLNEGLGVYVLHAWIFLDNPAGIFEDWNREVSCPS